MPFKVHVTLQQVIIDFTIIVVALRHLVALVTIKEFGYHTPLCELNLPEMIDVVMHPVFSKACFIIRPQGTTTTSPKWYHVLPRPSPHHAMLSST